METFYLGHTVLYAKNHYQRSKNIISNLKATMKADGYIVFGTKDISEMLLNLYAKLPYGGFSQVRNIVESLNPNNVWKFGYYTKDYSPVYIDSISKNLPDYDYETAIIYFVLSDLAMRELKDFDKPLPKSDKKVLPLNLIK